MFESPRGHHTFCPTDSCDQSPVRAVPLELVDALLGVELEHEPTLDQLPHYLAGLDWLGSQQGPPLRHLPGGPGQGSTDVPRRGNDRKWRNLAEGNAEAERFGISARRVKTGCGPDVRGLADEDAD